MPLHYLRNNKLSSKMKLKTAKAWKLRKFLLTISIILVAWKSAKVFNISLAVKSKW